MAWNADTTRMPYRMHSEYLHRLFLHNDLATGRYESMATPSGLPTSTCPASPWEQNRPRSPWKSVFKLHLLPVDLTFVLTNGGHNAGIVSEPGHPHRQLSDSIPPASGKYPIARSLVRSKPPAHDGSWWPAWQTWLAEHSSGQVSPPKTGNPETKDTF